MIMTETVFEKNTSDYIAELLNRLNINKVHGLMGGGASGLNDGFICNPNIEYLCYHHEQAAGYAALAEARLKRSWSILNPTTGCGSTNVYTPILNAWQDSIPLVVISGNVNSLTCSEFINDIYIILIRCYGVQENNIKCAAPIPKYVKTIFDKPNLEEVFIKAFSIALYRMGPWLDIPSDVQIL